MAGAATPTQAPSTTDRVSLIPQPGYLQSSRASLDSYLWSSVLGYTVHPLIPTRGYRTIADIPTNTGIWLMEAARELLDARVDGFDVAPAGAPHIQRLQPRLNLSDWNLRKDLPAELVGKYDIVHVRSLSECFELAEAQTVFKKLYQMLRPGGYLQWDDLVHKEAYVRHISERKNAPALKALTSIWTSNGRHWVSDLPKLLLEEGFEEAKVFKYGIPSNLTQAFTDLHMLELEDLATKIKEEGDEQRAEYVTTMIARGHQESLEGACLCVPRIVYVARKPALCSRR